MLTCTTVVTAKAWQCEVPKFWGINYQDPEAANAAPPNMAVDVTMEPTESEACANMLPAIGAVAGKSPKSILRLLNSNVVV